MIFYNFTGQIGRTVGSQSLGKGKFLLGQRKMSQSNGGGAPRQIEFDVTKVGGFETSYLGSLASSSEQQERLKIKTSHLGSLASSSEQQERLKIKD